MSHRVIYQLPQRLFRHFQLLDTLQSFVMDGRKQILRAESIHHTTCHLDDVALNHILYYQVALVSMETTYLDMAEGKNCPTCFPKSKIAAFFNSPFEVINPRLRNTFSVEALTSSSSIRPALILHCRK